MLGIAPLAHVSMVLQGTKEDRVEEESTEWTHGKHSHDERGRGKVRKERKLASEDCEEHYSGSRALGWPSYGRKRKTILGQRRQNEKIVVFFGQSQWCTCAGRK